MSLLPFQDLPKTPLCIIADYCSWAELPLIKNLLCRRIFYRSNSTDVYLQFDQEQVKKVFGRIVTEKLPVITYFQLVDVDAEVANLRLFATTTFVYHEKEVPHQGSRYLNLVEVIASSLHSSNMTYKSIAASCQSLGIQRVVKPVLAEAAATKKNPLLEPFNYDAWKNQLCENYPNREITANETTTHVESWEPYGL